MRSMLRMSSKANVRPEANANQSCRGCSNVLSCFMMIVHNSPKTITKSDNVPSALMYAMG